MTIAKTPPPGPLNAITDVPGLLVGQATDERAGTGVTTILLPDAWAAGVDIRGGGPGVRETAALEPENLVGRAHAIVLAGGSVFGLGAADAVAAILSARGVGLRLRPEGPAIPIVPAAVLHDLGNQGDKAWGETPPYPALGRRSVEAASATVALGSAGAGRGAMAGRLKGGIGTASLDLGDGFMVGAIVAANPVGSVVMADGATYWAWPLERDAEFGGRRPAPDLPPASLAPAEARLAELDPPMPGGNTVIAVVAASAALTTAECKRVAIMAHDGIARAVRPAHTPFDGDTVFAVANGAPLPDGNARTLALALIGAAAADCLARAIARAVHHA